MSEMTERSYDEVLEHEVLKKWEGKLIAWMKLGNGRRGVICNVRKAINRLSTSELQERCQAQFLRNLIDGLRRQKVFSVSQSCLTLYLLWDHLKATPIQWAWLKELSWYRQPTEERLADEAYRSGRSVTKVDVGKEKRSHERSVGDSPPMKRGSLRETPVDKEPVIKVASIVVVPESTTRMICNREEERMRSRILDRIREVKEVSVGAPQVPSQVTVCGKESEANVRSDPADYFIGALSKKHLEAEKLRNAGNVVHKVNRKRVYCLIDVEGTAPHLTEIAVMLVNEDEILSVRLYHLRVERKSDMIQGVKYCHGMDYEVLKKIATHSQEAAVEEIKDWIEGFGKARGEAIVVLSADEAKDSDVSRLVNGWSVRYLNVKMPRWKDRVNSQAYLETQVAKEAGVRIESIECPYKKLHRKEFLVIKNKPQVKDGAHCALADIKHLYRHLQINQMWYLVDEVIKDMKVPHVHGNL
jgi:hypothetical protein